MFFTNLNATDTPKKYAKKLARGANPLKDNAKHLVKAIAENDGYAPCLPAAFEWADKNGYRSALVRAIVAGLLKVKQPLPFSEHSPMFNPAHFSHLVYNQPASEKGPTLAAQFTTTDWAGALRIAVNRDVKTGIGTRAGDLASLLSSSFKQVGVDKRLAEGLKYALHQSVRAGHGLNVFAIAESVKSLSRDDENRRFLSPDSFCRDASGVSIFVCAASKTDIFDYLRDAFGVDHLSPKECFSIVRTLAKDPSLFRGVDPSAAPRILHVIQDKEPCAVSFGRAAAAIKHGNFSFVAKSYLDHLHPNRRTELLYMLCRQKESGRLDEQDLRGYAAENLMPDGISLKTLRRLLNVCDEQSKGGKYHLNRVKMELRRAVSTV